LEEIKEVAYDIDKNHDGKISKEELYEWLGKYWNSNE
jgi:Ca2+-binding EF-hand superfamily protein